MDAERAARGIRDCGRDNDFLLSINL